MGGVDKRGVIKIIPNQGVTECFIRNGDYKHCEGIIKFPFLHHPTQRGCLIFIIPNQGAIAIGRHKIAVLVLYINQGM